MARHVVHTCDNCGKVTSDKNPVIAKTFLTPVTEGRTRADHSQYTGHMTWGQCCATKVLGQNWRRRMTRTEYNNDGKGRGKLRPGSPTNAVAKSNGRATSKAK